MPQHPHNDRTLQRLLPWLALIGFLGVALYALLPLDFWLPEYKSAHHTVTAGEALPNDTLPEDDDSGDIIDDDLPPGGEKPETPSHETTTQTPSSSTTPQTSSSGTTPQIAPSGTTPQTPSSDTTPQTAPSGTTTQASPSGTTTQASPSGTTTQASPSSTTPQTPPSGTTPQIAPSGTTPQTPPSGTTPQTPPSGTTPQTPPGETKPAIPPSGSTPQTPSSETKPAIPPGSTTPQTPPGGEKPQASAGSDEKTIESKGDFHKHYRIFRAVGNQWQNISKSDLNPVLIKQLEPLQHKIEDEAVSTVEILYTTYTKDGKTNLENSKIIAARLREGRYTYTYYARFEGKNIWYYDREGNAPEVAMDRIPLDHYDHISSPFDPARVHPITRIIRPHEGTDFKAAHGSPVRATGDGIVNYAGWRGGYGRVVIIDHVNGYQTRYAHLSDLDVETGQEVARGQTVGRLGNSGMSTGSHLHYEVRINDIPYDPMTVQLPENKPLPESYKDAWRYRCTQYEREMTEIAKGGRK